MTAVSTLTVVDDFLDLAACRRIERELEFTWWHPSTVVNKSDGGDLVTFRSRRRDSWSAQQEYFSPQLCGLLAEIEGRLESSVRLKSAHLEQWQAIRYDIGGHFDLHDDAGLFGGEPAGERHTTVLIYLHSAERGGGTAFPQLQRTVEARAGRLVMWANLTADGHIDQQMRHRAVPLIAGRKTVLTTWGRQHPVPGRRSPTGTKEAAHDA